MKRRRRKSRKRRRMEEQCSLRQHKQAVGEENVAQQPFTCLGYDDISSIPGTANSIDADNNNNWQKQEEEEHGSPSRPLHSMISESQNHSWEDEGGLAGTRPRYSPSLVPSPTDESIKGPWRDLQISSRVLGGIHRSGINDLLLISVNFPSAGAWSHQRGE